MTITDQIGLLEAERDRLKTENESLKTRLAKQAGALDESRAQNRQLILRNEKLSAHIATLEKHFYDFHGSAERIDTQRKELKAQENGAPVSEVINSPARVATIKERIASIMKRDEAATTGAKNGSAA